MTLDRHDLDTLTTALVEASKAHHTYEGVIGHPDTDWARWYAEYMILHHDSKPLVLSLQEAFANAEGY